MFLLIDLEEQKGKGNRVCGTATALYNFVLPANISSLSLFLNGSLKLSGFAVMLVLVCHSDRLNCLLINIL